jgi:very-short-patch-repair endonuclease
MSGVPHPRNSWEKQQFNKQLRYKMTPAEQRAWSILRNRGCLGLKFRRQRPVDSFITDFYCSSLRVLLEVDGSIHDNPTHQIADRKRTEILESYGVRVVRIKNHEVSREKLEALLRPLL